MSDQSTNGAALKIAEATAEAEGGKNRAHKAVFKTLTEAQECPPPEGTKLRTYEVSDGGEALGFTWAASPEGAVYNAAKSRGYSARVAEPKAQVTKDVIASRLSQFSDEELEALGLARKAEPKKGKAKKQKAETPPSSSSSAEAGEAPPKPLTKHEKWLAQQEARAAKKAQREAAQQEESPAPEEAPAEAPAENNN